MGPWPIRAATRGSPAVLRPNCAATRLSADPAAPLPGSAATRLRDPAARRLGSVARHDLTTQAEQRPGSAGAWQRGDPAALRAAAARRGDRSRALLLVSPCGPCQVSASRADLRTRFKPCTVLSVPVWLLRTSYAACASPSTHLGPQNIKDHLAVSAPSTGPILVWPPPPSK